MFPLYTITPPTILDVKYYELETFSLEAITDHSFPKADGFQMYSISLQCALNVLTGTYENFPTHERDLPNW